MKKTLFTSMILFIAIVTFGQETTQLDDTPFIPSNRPTGTPVSDPQWRAAPFWIEDFAGGFPAGWSIIDSSGICPWTYSTDGSWGNFNGNNATAAAAGISSTTAANGFLIMDADSANHFTYGQPSGANYQYLSSYFQTSALDCSGRSSVILSFQQFFRYNNGVAMNVQVSNDGTNWTTYNVANGQANNASSTNPTLISVNISTIAANQSSVYIRIGWSARVYYWMIDDLALSEADPNDVRMVDGWWGMGNAQHQYYRIPESQYTPITFYGEVNNFTGATLNGCGVDVEVSNSVGTTAYSGTTNALSLNANEIDTVTSTSTWTPMFNSGIHTVEFTATTTSGLDGNPANNNFSDSLLLTTYTFGLDNLVSSTASISNWASNTGGQFKIGNIYEVFEDDYFCKLEIGIANNTNSVGNECYGEVYKYDPVTDDWVFLEATDFVPITAADLGNVITVPLLSAISVFTGDELLVVAGHVGGLPNGSQDVSFMYGQRVPDQMVWGFNATNDLLWLTNPRAIVVRLNNNNCISGINEHSATINVDAYPNPTNSELTISIATSEGTSGSIVLYDLSGKEVSKSLFLATSGTYSTNMNTSGIANGMYTLSIETDAGSKKQKIQVLH